MDSNVQNKYKKVYCKFLGKASDDVDETELLCYYNYPSQQYSKKMHYLPQYLVYLQDAQPHRSPHRFQWWMSSMIPPSAFSSCGVWEQREREFLGVL